MMYLILQIYRQISMWGDLRWICLVSDHKEGKWHHYSINTEVWKEFDDFISSIGGSNRDGR